MRLAPTWNAALKQLKEKSGSMSEPEQMEIANRFGKIMGFIFKCEKSERAAVVLQFLDGIKCLGEIQTQGNAVEKARANALAPRGKCEPKNDAERHAALKADLAYLNDATRLNKFLQTNPNIMVNWFSDRFTELEKAGTAVSLAAELNNISEKQFGLICNSLKGSQRLNDQQKREALDIVEKLARQMNRWPEGAS
jgi:hypothetical protein